MPVAPDAARYCRSYFQNRIKTTIEKLSSLLGQNPLELSRTDNFILDFQSADIGVLLHQTASLIFIPSLHWLSQDELSHRQVVKAHERNRKGLYRTGYMLGEIGKE